MPSAPRIFKRLSELLDVTGQTGVVYVTGGTASFIATSGTGNIARVASPTFTGTVNAAALTASGTISANLFSGSGASLTGVVKDNATLTLTGPTIIRPSSGTEFAVLAPGDTAGFSVDEVGTTFTGSLAGTGGEFSGFATVGTTTVNATTVNATTVSIGGLDAVTVSGIQAVTNKTFTSCTFPTLNQNSTGSAASLSVSGQTGLMTVTGLASTNRIKTVRDAADTILELGGSYTPTGTWTNMNLATPNLGTPSAIVLTNGTSLPATSLTGTIADARNTVSNSTTTTMSALGTIGGLTTVTGTGAMSITGGAGNMTITAGTGASRTLTLQTTTSGSTATNALTINATQQVTVSSSTDATSTSNGALVVTGGASIGSAIYCGSSITSAGGGQKRVNLGSSGTSMQAAAVLAWSSTTDATASYDTNISRSGTAGTVQFGTTAANASGSWTATNGTLSGTLGVTGASTLTGGIVGVITVSNATAGNLGQTISSLVASGSAVSLTTATAANVTSISLTAGDWWVQANVNFTMGTATVTQKSAGISTTSATLPTDGSEVNNGSQFTLTSATDGVTTAWKRVNVSSTTTVYLVTSATFSAGTIAAFGSLVALRASR